MRRRHGTSSGRRRCPPRRSGPCRRSRGRRGPWIGLACRGTVVNGTFATRWAIGYLGHGMERLQLDVYPSETEAFETTAERATLALREGRAARGRAHAALAGGRGGRGVMAALTGSGDLPWNDVVWWLGDERCVPSTDPRSNQRLARETLFIPRGIPADRI